MAFRSSSSIALGCSLAAVLTLGAPLTAQQTRAPLGVDSARITLSGTSNVHDYSLSTTELRVTRVQFASTVAGPGFWNDIVKPGALQAFEIAIPVATLASTKPGLATNLQRAIKAQEHPDFNYRLTRTEPGAEAGTLTAIGVLRVAGVERDVTFPLVLTRRDNTLTVKGELSLLMTDFGITPPVAAMGTLKTDPRVTIVFETVLSIPLT
jgi:polyisoprenoid-binding protein YceI